MPTYDISKEAVKELKKILERKKRKLISHNCYVTFIRYNTLPCPPRT